jgi:hypothetical protein
MDVKIAFLNGDLNEIIYVEQPKGFIHKLQKRLVSLLFKSNYGFKQSSSSLTLMKDGAPIYRSKAPKVWKDRQALRKLEWPAQSPDLNPIENIWKVLKDGVQNQHRPKNMDEMKVALQMEWEAFVSKMLSSLVASMPKWLKAVINAKGGSTRW